MSGGDYLQQMTVEQFGAMVATASARGRLRQRPLSRLHADGCSRPVRYDPTEAPREDRASAVLLAGTLGSGKTVAAQAIAYAAERAGSLVVDFDPKPDHGLHRLPELQGRVEVLELSGDPAQRQARPARDRSCRAARGAGLLLSAGAAAEPPPAWENAIDRAVRDAVRAGARSTSPSCRAVAEKRPGSGDRRPARRSR